MNVYCISKYKWKCSQIHLQIFLPACATKATSNITYWDRCEQEKMNKPILDTRMAGKSIWKKDCFLDGDNFCFVFMSGPDKMFINFVSQSSFPNFPYLNPTFTAATLTQTAFKDWAKGSAEDKTDLILFSVEFVQVYY